jgi:hypothetical protein
MAEDNIGLDVGINFNEDQFVDAFKRTLNTLSAETSKFIQVTTDHLKGAAAKDWNKLPFYSMHSSLLGNQRASQAFTASFADELKGLGIKQGTEVYESSLMSAAYRSTIPNATQRNLALLAQGKNAVSPDSAVERVLEADYKLMSQPWSRKFIRQTPAPLDVNSLTAGYSKMTIPELKELADTRGVAYKSKTKKADLINKLLSSDAAAYSEALGKVGTFDFEAMREYAAKEGFGRWRGKNHTAENFELTEKTDKALEKIEKKASKTTTDFSNWGHELKGVLGVLTAIGGTALKIGGVALVANKVAEKTIEEAAKSVDARRGFLDMTVTESLEAQTAGRAVGLSGDAVFNEIEKLSTQREEFLTLGKGLDPLYSSLQGTFGIIAAENDPYVRYKKMATRLYEDLKDASPDTLRTNLMYLDKQGLGSLAHIVGSFISNPDLAKQYGNDPAKLFSLLYNPYREGAYTRAEQINADIQPLKESIKASYTELANLWMERFGTPFLGWWDTFLQNNVIPFTNTKFFPWLEKVLGGDYTRENQASYFWNRHQKDFSYMVDLRNKAIEAEVPAMVAAGNRYMLKDVEPDSAAYYNAKSINWFTRTYGSFARVNPYNKYSLIPEDYNGLWANDLTHRWYEKYVKESERTDTDIEKEFKDDRARQGTAKSFRDRMAKFNKYLKDTGLDRFITNKQDEAMDTIIMGFGNKAIYSDEGLEAATKALNSYLSMGTDTKGASAQVMDKAVELLAAIVENTKQDKDAMLATKLMQTWTQTFGGPGFAEQLQHSYSTPTDINRQ